MPGVLVGSDLAATAARDHARDRHDAHAERGVGGRFRDRRRGDGDITENRGSIVGRIAGIISDLEITSQRVAAEAAGAHTGTEIKVRVARGVCRLCRD